MSNTLRRLSGAGAILLGLGLFAGCQSSDSPVSSKSQTRTADDVESLSESRVLLAPSATAPALGHAMAQVDVAAARELLESEGYTYVESNSLVLIHGSGAVEQPAFDAAAQELAPRRPHDRVGRGRVDTVSWLAFENPLHDLANHTAVLYFSNGIKSGTFLVELDISEAMPQVVRQGYFQEGQWQEGDVGTESWLACMAGGLAGSIVRCSMTNCGYGHCLGAGSAISLAGCTAVSLWNWMNS